MEYPVADSGDAFEDLLDLYDAVEAKETKCEIVEDGEGSWAGSEMSSTGVLAPGGVADVLHAIFYSPAQADMGVDGSWGGAVPTQTVDDEGVFLGEAATFEVELFAADDGNRPSKREANVLGGGGPDSPSLDAPARAFLFFVPRRS
ncbi:hypothetical protein ND748_02215 [Frankia sp. AiPs1]|uniref:hypothetical protein n=1 Tax=Frankia sp. AiPs1 TaxID=573493 RepID=UPI002043E686|nr:hypothetical protein [Frankia sp. AiPs1]MCM3920498.1 hypothetical protein [Frankia sp. AiPs1]